VDIYCVGGAVRDELLGLPVRDHDYVVVGATPEEMVRRGFKPVGKDFPVFLHPQTKEEYALARTERKVARGYKGFTVYATPEVTLEQDLARRDLTINAIAKDAEGSLIDPFGGAGDLRAGILRHVSPSFAEDPVRILRVARFAARFGFPVAEETMDLMRTMVLEGEADALVSERVWQEFAKGLMEPAPERMFFVLARSGLLERLLPELGFAIEDYAPANDAARTVLGALGYAARNRYSLAVRFALLFFRLRGSGAAETAARTFAEVVTRLRAPNDCRELAVTMHRHGDWAKRAAMLPPESLLALLEGCDAFRRPGRLDQLLLACEAECYGERGWVERPFPPRLALGRALAAASGIDAGAIAARSTRARIQGNVRKARLAAIARSFGRRG
jgi:tRNA nucleotidyltransferase (CCA-adding enzyme)